MNRKVVAPLIVALTMSALLVIGCSPKNAEPVIETITTTPNDTVAPGGMITLKVTATDSDDDPLTFEWSTTAGTLSSPTGDSVGWTAPASPVTCTLTVICSDDADGVDTATQLVWARSWLKDDILGSTADSTYLPNTGTTDVPFVWDAGDTLKPGAVVDTLEITLGFDDSDTLELEQFTLHLVSPQGTEVLLYDGDNLTTLDLSQLVVEGFAGEPVAGTWKLKFVRSNPSGYNGVVEQCDLDVIYKY